MSIPSLRIPSDTELQLVQLEKKFANLFKSAISADEGVEATLDTLTKKITQSINAKKDLLAKMREIEKLSEDIVQDPNASVTPDQARDYSDLIGRYAQLLENNQDLVAGIKDIILAYESFLGKKQTYYDAYAKYVSLKSDLQKNVYNYRKMTNRLQNDSKVRQLEEDIRVKDQELARLERDNVRQLGGLIDEGKAVDEAWLQLRDYIKEFSF